MAVIETWYNQDLQQPVKVHYLDGSMFSHNGNGNCIGVHVFNNGEPVTLTGTVSGYVVTSDGATVPCTGSRSGNSASILIPAAAYQPGAVFITVFITDGTTVTTLASVSTSVLTARTNNQIDPGSVVTDWTQTINGAMQDVQTAADNLGGIVATPYASLTFPVPLGKYTYYNGNLYRCISPIATSESFTAAHWTQVVLGNEVSDLNSAVEQNTNSFSVLYNRSENYTNFVQGTRSATDDIREILGSSTRCTTGRSWYLEQGDTIAVSNNATGTRVMIIGTYDGGTYSSGWKTSDFRHTVQQNGLYSVVASASNGTSAITPASIATIVTIADNFSRMSKSERRLYSINGIVDTFKKNTNVNIELENGQGIRQDNGAKINTDKYARSKYIISGSGVRIAVGLTNEQYEFSVLFYNENGSFQDGTGYLGEFSDYGDKPVIIPTDAKRIGISFRRKDLANLSADDITAITSAYVEYYFIDSNLTLCNANDYVFGSASNSNNVISYTFSGRNRVRNKYKLKNTYIHIIAEQGYSSLVFTASTILNNNTGEYISPLINEEFAVVLRNADGSDIVDYDDFMSHFTIEVYCDKNDYIKPSDGVIHFKVPVNINKAELDTDNNVGDSEVLAYDNGILVIPSNYNSNLPVRLAIVCHGAGATPYENRTMDDTGKIIGDPQRVLNKMGYAVMDMYANPYDFSGGTDELHYGNPVALQCYIKGYEYVKKFFNIKEDGVLVCGSSMGGLTSFDIVNSSGIPVLAQAGFCPCVDLFKQAYCNPWSSPATQRKNIAEYFGFEGTEPTWTSNKYPSDAEKTYFIENYGKTIGYYPIMHGGTGTNFDTLSSVAPQSATAQPQDEKALYDQLSVFHRVPLKIWHCEDDTTMAFRYSKYIVDSMNRNGCLAFLRPFTTGGHSAWAAGEDVVMTDVEGNQFTAKASQYECYLWFKRFE